MARKILVMGITPWASGQFASKISDKISQNPGVHQGRMVGFKLTVNDNTGNCSVVLKVRDKDGDVIYTSGDCPRATTVVMGLNVPLIEQETIEITPSGDPGESGLKVENIVLYYYPDPVLP